MTNKDYDIIDEIVQRATDMASTYGTSYDNIDALMDIESAHLDTPLDLNALLTANDVNFAHDVFGIRRHMDRTNYPGKLTDCFRPRCAA